MLATHGHNGTTSTSTLPSTRARDVDINTAPRRRRRRGVCATAWIGAVETFVVYPFHWVFRLAEGPGYPRGSLLRRPARASVEPPQSGGTGTKSRSAGDNVCTDADASKTNGAWVLVISFVLHVASRFDLIHFHLVPNHGTSPPHINSPSFHAYIFTRQRRGHHPDAVWICRVCLGARCHRLGAVARCCSSAGIVDDFDWLCLQVPRWLGI